MAFITGLFLIDAPASALNNGEAEDTKAMVKQIRTRAGNYPYVSAQAFRFWLRETLTTHFRDQWQASPVSGAGAGKKQQAYTEGDPITYHDDDLLGYMRAISSKEGETITRVSPFRTSTLVSLAPASIVDDFGVMARVPKHEGDKEGVVLHGHQFYRTVLQGLFSLDLGSAGTFTNQRRSGYQNLGKASLKQAESEKLEHLPESQAYRLPIEERVRRVQMLMQALGRVEGGAKQALHYTDVSPVFMLAAVTKGGNHIFGHSIMTDNSGQPVLNEAALRQIGSTFENDLLSPIYVGRVEGFMDSSQRILDEFGMNTLHPRQALDALANDLAQNHGWFD